MIGHISVVIVLFFGSFSDAQQVPVCSCNDIAPCKSAMIGSTDSCIDTCKAEVGHLGNPNSLKACIQGKSAAIRATIGCIEGSYPNACANSPGKMVAKRNFGSLKIAFSSEVMRMFKAWGVSDQIGSLMSVGKKVAGCMQRCMSQNAGNCEKKLKCGLDLPSDNVLAKNTIQCAVKSGFDTASAKALCECLVAGGLKQIAGVCGKINMNA